jgi:hypothetical protein
MAARYGEAAICVRFDWGEGEVLHMVSHYVRRPRLGEVEAAYSSSRFLANLVASKKQGGARRRAGPAAMEGIGRPRAQSARGPQSGG